VFSLVLTRPIIASQKDKLRLQDCLEAGRTAKVFQKFLAKVIEMMLQ